MRHPALLTLAVFLRAQLAEAQPVDVLVQAGHVGRPASCAVFHVRHCNIGTHLGEQREADWTAVVARAVVTTLTQAGYSVTYRPADWGGGDHAQAAVFLHFDGSTSACSGGASVGFPAATNGAFVSAWERFYRPKFPFAFRGENISPNERAYYGFRKVTTQQKSMLIEFGELTCPTQERWMQPRLVRLGRDVADFLETQVTK